MIKIPYKRKIQETGNGLSANIPSEITQHLNWKKGDKINIIVDKNKEDEIYVAIYKKGQKK